MYYQYSAELRLQHLPDWEETQQKESQIHLAQLCISMISMVNIPCWLGFTEETPFWTQKPDHIPESFIMDAAQPGVYTIAASSVLGANKKHTHRSKDAETQHKCQYS